MDIKNQGYPLPISKELIEILTKGIRVSGNTGNKAVILNFRDTGYSPDTGGFHPVEVMVAEDGSIQYITDFAYVGYPPELAKELDFDFSLGLFQHMGKEFPIGYNHSLFCLWQVNFCSYYDMGVYTVRVEALS